MKTSNRVVALLFTFLVSVGVQVAPNVSFAQTQNAQDDLDRLFSELLIAGPEEWQSIEKKIWTQWGKSGSRAMDTLLARGRAEMNEGNVFDAINHFSALIDHAPEFAEGWNARATAFFVADRYGLSMADIRQTLLLEPRHFGAMAGLGMILERIDRPEDALKAYREVAKVHPNRPDAVAAIERLEAQLEGEPL